MMDSRRCEVIPKLPSADANSVAIIGYEEGGPGLVHSWLYEASGMETVCFVNPALRPPEIDIARERALRDSRLFEFPTSTSYRGLPLLTSERWAEHLVHFGIGKVLVALSTPRQKLMAMEQARSAGLRLINAIHPTALILPEAELADNVILHARALVGYRAVIGAGGLLNTGAQLDHHAVVHPGAMIDPGVVAAGNVTIGSCARIHTGAIIRNRIRIGDDAVVGAGAVVIADVPPGATVVGNPARPIRSSHQKPDADGAAP